LNSHNGKICAAVKLHAGGDEKHTEKQIGTFDLSWSLYPSIVKVKKTAYWLKQPTR